MLKELKIADINIGKRHRKDMGDLVSLADSIRHDGFLQPIGVTEKLDLVFGERRLRAHKDVLKKKTILARIVNVPSIIAGEYAENEIRKDFTPSERVAIAKAIEQQLGNRRGQRTDKHVEKVPHVAAGKKTREIAAGKAGFGNDNTYRQAAKVVLKGTTRLIQAMDSGRVSISAASILVDAEPFEQDAIVELDEQAILQAAREIRLRKGLGTTGRGLTDDWQTPPHILMALGGKFDLDPCASLSQRTRTAKRQYTIIDNGLNKDWKGRVWMNPPYGPETQVWLAKMAKHRNGIALVFARTDTKMFSDSVWKCANGILFLRGRVSFGKPDHSFNGAATAPSVLISYDLKGTRTNHDILKDCKLEGKFFEIK